jgi:hypothetical protein
MAVPENYRKYHEIIFLIIIIKHSNYSYFYGSKTNCHLPSVIFVLVFGMSNNALRVDFI